MLNISDNSIGDAGAKAISKGLGSLITLNISLNSIGEAGAKAISEGLGSLITLDISDNSIGEAGAKAISKGLGSLSMLDISNNSIGDKGLELLATSQFLAFTSVNFDENESENIPESALESWATLRQHFFSLQIGNKKHISTAKILLLGNTTAGKTNLASYYLSKEKFNPAKIKTTYGIQHKNDTKNEINLSVWDFGGQEYFHGTHRLFLYAKNAIYLVLWEQQYEDKKDGSRQKENDNGDACYPFRYWLGTIRHFNQTLKADNIFLIQSKGDVLDNPKVHISDIYTDAAGQFKLPPENIMFLSVHAAHKAVVPFTLSWQLFESRFNEVLQQSKSNFELNEDLYNLTEKIGTDLLANKL